MIVIYYVCTIFPLLETIPDIYNPMRDQFITIEKAEFQKFHFDCGAEGNPTPLVNWTRMDKSSIGNYQPYSSNLSFTTNDLKLNQINVYVCNASNRVGSVQRIITVNYETQNVSMGVLSVLRETLTQIDLQPSINSEQAQNISALVVSSLDSTANYTTDLNCTNEFISTPNCPFDKIKKTQIRTVANMTLQVNIKLEEDTLDQNSSQILFSGNARVVQSSLAIQNGTTQNNKTQVNIKISSVRLLAYLNVELGSERCSDSEHCTPMRFPSGISLICPIELI